VQLTVLLFASLPLFSPYRPALHFLSLQSECLFLPPFSPLLMAGKVFGRKITGGPVHPAPGQPDRFRSICPSRPDKTQKKEGTKRDTRRERHKARGRGAGGQKMEANLSPSHLPFQNRDRQCVPAFLILRENEERKQRLSEKTETDTKQDKARRRQDKRDRSRREDAKRNVVYWDEIPKGRIQTERQTETERVQPLRFSEYDHLLSLLLRDVVVLFTLCFFFSTLPPQYSQRG